LAHETRLSVCPTTGLRIERHDRLARRQAQARRPESPERLLGWVIDDKYRIVSLIGQGGMSAIYEAEHIGGRGAVAIKVLHPALADDPDAIARLRHEALVVGAIGHPNLCEIYDLGRTPDGSAYLAMERLVGESLAERIRHFGPMSFGELAPIVLQILAALEAAHQKGILHRDLKPENVFVVEQPGRASPTAKLLDFGISKSMGYDFGEQQRLTHSGMVMGTPYYMSPEQARGDSNLDQRVDLWAVAVLMYEALTGRRPFVATNYNALLVKILTSRPRPIQKVVAGIPDAVAALVDRGLSKLREDRFQTAAAFIDVVKRVQRDTVAEDPHAPTMVIRRPRQHDLMSDTRRDRASQGRDWSLDVDDPETFVDDDLVSFDDHAPANARARSVHTRPGGTKSMGGHLATLDDDVPEPLEPTVQERVDDPSYLDALGEATDTDVSAYGDVDWAAGGSYDDENTSLYDIEAGQQQLDARRKRASPTSEDEDDGDTSPQDRRRKS
jgi:serine/threonine protein kinase